MILTFKENDRRFLAGRRDAWSRSSAAAISLRLMFSEFKSNIFKFFAPPAVLRCVNARYF